MNEQYEKSLTKLELDKVLAMLSDHAASQAAKDRCLAVRPSTDADEIRHLLDETSAACACITVKGSPSFGGLYDVGASLDRADRGGCLSPEELLRIAAVLKSARQTKAYSEGEGRSAQEPGVLDVYFQQITTNKYLEERIFTSILSKDEIADAASSELASIRRRIRQQSAKIRESLQKIITSPSYAKILQEPIVTIRSDRFVVPVKAECKSQLPGLVHDVSSSGSTYFIEPMSAVNGNNELRELFMAERKEIERILAELSAEAAGHREQIKLDYDVLLDLECIFARARLSFAMRAICPEVRTDGQLNLIRARHPLITGKTIVPMISAQDHKRIFDNDEGPNTGGMGVYSPVPIVTDEEHATMVKVMEQTVAELAAEGIDYRGCLYGGFMLTPAGPKVLEFNARFGDPETQVVLPRLKNDLVEVMLACANCELDQIELDWRDEWAVAVVLTSAGYPGSYEKGKVITGIADAEAMENVTVYHAGTAVVDGQLVTNGGRVLAVTALGDTFENARNLAYEACEKIDFEGKTLRHDIGLRALRGRDAWDA